MLLFDWFKVGCGVLAEGTDEVFGEWVALVNVAADLTNVTLFALGLRFGFNVCVVVAIGHSFLIGNNARLVDGADEHSVRAEVNVIFNGEGHKGIDIF